MKRVKQKPSWPTPPPLADHFSSRIIPRHIVKAAESANDSVGDFTRIWSIDDPPIQTFLRTLRTAGELVAMQQLTKLLHAHPLILGHPFVWDVFQFLHTVSSPYKELTQYAEEWLVTLMRAWFEGITGGAKITIDLDPRRGSGHPIAMFPMFTQTKGWYLSDQALGDRRAAIAFIDAYEDLHGFYPVITDG